MHFLTERGKELPRAAGRIYFHFNLETAVGREKDVQDIDVHGEFEKRVVTLLVMSIFFKFPRCIKSLCRLSVTSQ